MWGADQAASVEIVGLVRLVANLRDIERSLGDGVKRVHEGELAARAKLRRVRTDVENGVGNGASKGVQQWRHERGPERRVSLAVLSPIVIAAWAVLMVLLERRFPYDRDQKLLRRGFFDDFFWYTLAQSYVLGLVISWVIAGIDASTHLSRLHLVSDWPIAAQLAFFWVTHDLYIYWFHRAQHNSRWLWRIHEAHHSGHDVDWLSGSRSHALEILINQTIEYAPIVLLGGHPDVALLKGVLDATWGMYIHSNIDVRAGWLQRVLNGPEMHRWHHSGDVTEGGFNYATKIALWDWLFGTAYLPEAKPRRYGLSGGVQFPDGYFAQTVFAFRPFAEDAARAEKAQEAPAE